MKVIVRTYSAGVHYGTLKDEPAKQLTLHDSIRIHYWDGAASLSQMAKEGVKKPENCRFAVKLDKIILTEAIEIIPCTPEASANIESVKTWRV